VPRVRDLLLFWVSACASAPASDASMLDFLRWISAADHRVWAHLEAAVLGWRLPAGTAALYEAIAADVRGEIALGAPVRSIAQSAAGGVTVTTATGDRFHAARAALTVPVGVLASIEFGPGLSEPKRRASRENHAGQGVKAWVLARGVPGDFCAVGHETRLDFAGAMAECDGAVLLVCFGPSAAGLDVTDDDAVRDAVHELAPEAEVVAVHAHDWARDPYSLGTWSVMRPGQIHSAWSALRAPEGRVHFAGAHTALRWPSFMDGAIESGFRVAEEIGAGR
jgi:monoamine oxidase